MRTLTRTALAPAVIAVVAAITACGSSGPSSSSWYQRGYQYGERSVITQEYLGTENNFGDMSERMYCTSYAEAAAPYDITTSANEAAWDQGCAAGLAVGLERLGA